MFNLNTVAFIILILIIIIAIIALLKVGMNSRDAFGITKSSPQETFTTKQSFQIKKGVSPEIQWLFERQRGMDYDLDTVCKAGACYNVRTDIDDVPETVRLFEEIDLMIEQLTYCMQVKYTYRPPVFDPITGQVLRKARAPLVEDKYREMITNNILNRYKRKNIIENSTDNRTQTSFVTDKGKLFAICTRLEKGTGKHHDLELLKFIALHELAHVANSMPGTENHGPEFWRTFKMLLLEAKDNGLCSTLKTQTGSVKYCNGLVLTDSNLDLTRVEL